MKIFLKFLLNNLKQLFMSVFTSLHYLFEYWHIIQRKIYSFYIRNLCNCSNVYFEPTMRYLRGVEYISIGEDCRFGRKAILTALQSYANYRYNPSIKIGNGCNFGDYIQITSINDIEIGDNVLTGKWVLITDHSHGSTTYMDAIIPPNSRKLISKGRVRIGNNVWIGDKVTVLPNVKIGEGSIIGANSVITKDIPPYSVAVGNPAKVIKVFHDILSDE